MLLTLTPFYWKEAGDKTIAIRKGMLGSGINSLSICLMELRVQLQGIFQGDIYAQGEVWQQHYVQHSYWLQWELLAESQGRMALEVCDRAWLEEMCACFVLWVVFFNERAANLVVFWPWSCCADSIGVCMLLNTARWTLIYGNFVNKLYVCSSCNKHVFTSCK